METACAADQATHRIALDLGLSQGSRASAFHLIGPDTAVLIDMRDLQVMRGTYRRGDLRMALGWASTHMAELERAWSEQNDKS